MSFIDFESKKSDDLNWYTKYKPENIKRLATHKKFNTLKYNKTKQRDSINITFTTQSLFLEKSFLNLI